MPDLISRVCAPTTLGYAFDGLARAKGLWCPHVSMQHLRIHPGRHLLQLADELAQGRYRPDAVQQFAILKADGSRRLITSYSVRDRVAQRAVLHVLQPLGERLFLDCSYGYRPGLTVDMAYNRVREWVRHGYHWVGDADIASCFDRIPRRSALRILQALATDPNLIKLVASWLDVVPSPEASPCCGLPQGMAISPFLCNLYLHRLDVAMRQQEIPMVRYADDFVLLARSRDAASRALHLAGRRLQALELSLHPAKTKVIHSTRRHRFLGRRLPELAACKYDSQP